MSWECSKDTGHLPLIQITENNPKKAYRQRSTAGASSRKVVENLDSCGTGHNNRSGRPAQ